MDTELTAIEAETYRRAELQDGIVDIACGAALVAWGLLLWMDLGGLGGVAFVVLFPAALSLRKRLVEPRIGHVRLERTALQRRKLLTIGLLTLTFLGGIGAFLVFGEGGAEVIEPWRERFRDLGDLALGLLLALVATVVGVIYRAPRAHLYAIAAVATFLIFRVAGPIEGWRGPILPIAVSGLVPVVYGSVLLMRFLRHRPVTAAPEGLFDARD